MSNLTEKITEAYKELNTAQEKLRMLHQERPPEEVKNYEFTGPQGTTTLADLFDNKDELLLIHNMGKKCSYCTLWADGFNGVSEHLQNRAAFALTSPDPFSELQEFAQSRNWRFPVYSTRNEDFQKDMGYWEEDHYGMGPSSTPGVSTFLKKERKIFRQTHTGFGPGDLYSSIWHLFDLLPKGQNEWAPKYTY